MFSKAKIIENIKKAGFMAWASVFNVAARLPVKQKSVVLFNLIGKSGAAGALGEVEKELLKRGGCKIIHIDRDALFSGKASILKFMTKDAYDMARAKYVFINNNFFPFGYTHPNKDAMLIQVWHGQGAFKKFGLDIPQPKDVRKKEIGANKNLSFVTCSAESIRPVYMSAFGIPAEKVITTGNPVTDYFFREENVSDDAVTRKRALFDEKYPQCKGKRLYLYAPTFRDDPDDDKSLLENIDLKRLKMAIVRGISGDCELLVRLHPNDSLGRDKLKKVCVSTDGVTDVTDYPDSNELCVLSDVLITDYSSICMNNALLEKPIVFYAYDFDSFESDRSFYYNYEETAGGPVVKNMDDLCEVFEKRDFRMERLAAFRELHFGRPDGHAAEALLDRIMGDRKTD